MTHRSIRAEHSAALDAWHASGRKGPRPTPLRERLAASHEPRPEVEEGGRDTLPSPPPDLSVTSSAPCRPPSPPRGDSQELKTDLRKCEAGASRVATIVSDLHFEESTDWAAWRAYRQFHRDVSPHTCVILGDFVDFSAISRYPAGSETPAYVIPEIKCFVREANALRENSRRLVVVEGNHDGDRWSRTVAGEKAMALKGALGLDLKSQCQRHGLDERIEWFRESVQTPHLQLGQFSLAHGHRDAGPWGGGKNVAARMLANGYGEDQIQGHTHLSQLHAVTTPSGRTVVAIANGCFQRRQDYKPRAAWTHSFTVVELHAPDFQRATAYPVVIERGRFSLWGKTYDGNG